MKAIRRFTVRTVLPPALEPLGELALNLRWSWDTATQSLFRDLDPRLWDDVGGDPVQLLGALGQERLAALAVDAPNLVVAGSANWSIPALRRGSSRGFLA